MEKRDIDKLKYLLCDHKIKCAKIDIENGFNTDKVLLPLNYNEEQLKKFFDLLENSYPENVIIWLEDKMTWIECNGNTYYEFEIYSYPSYESL